MAGDYDDGRHQRGFSGGNWNDYQRGQNDRARWDAHVADRSKPAGGFPTGSPPGGGGSGGVGGGGLAILIVALVGLVLVLPAGLLAMAATPVLVLLARWPPEARSFRALFLPMWKACFAFAALHALGLVILTYGSSLLGSDLGTMTAAFVDTLGGAVTGTRPWPGLAALGGMLAAMLPMVILALVLALGVPLAGMALVLRLGLSDRHVEIGFGRALILSLLSLIGAGVLIAALVALQLAFGRPLGVAFHIWAIGTLAVALVISGIAGGLFALLSARRSGRPAGIVVRTAAPALMFWAVTGGLAFYLFRGADPLVVTLLYPGGGLEPMAITMGLPAFLLMQLPGALIGWRWMAASGLWAPGRASLLASLALLATGLGVGTVVAMIVVRMAF